MEASPEIFVSSSVEGRFGRDNHRPHLSREYLISVSVELWILLLVGVLGNSLVIAVFVKRIRQKRRSQANYRSSNYAVLSLICVDNLVLVVSAAFYWAHLFQSSMTSQGCFIATFLQSYVSAISHAIVTVAVPIERVGAICFLKWPKLQLSGKQTCTLLVTISLSMLGLSIPIASWTETANANATHLCESTRLSQMLVLQGVFTGVPVIFMVGCYTLVLLEMWRVQKDLRLLSVNGANVTPREFVRRSRIVWITLVVTLMYILSWIPFILIVVGVIPDDYRYRCLHLINNASTFIVYGLMSSSLRRDVRCTLMCCSKTCSDATRNDLKYSPQQQTTDSPSHPEARRVAFANGFRNNTYRDIDPVNKRIATIS